MKKKLIIVIVLFTMVFTFLSACDAKNAGPLQSITHPYIAQYECVEASLGEDDLLKKFDYIKITLLNKETLELSYKLKDGDRKTIKTNYNFDLQSRELSAEIGILGFSFKQSTVIEKGKFTVSKAIAGKQLIMKFKAT